MIPMAIGFTRLSPSSTPGRPPERSRPVVDRLSKRQSQTPTRSGSRCALIVGTTCGNPETAAESRIDGIGRLMLKHDRFGSTHAAFLRAHVKYSLNAIQPIFAFHLAFPDLDRHPS